MGKKLKIIVADDESIIRLGLRTMLTELGHEVSLAANGREALNLARTIQADLAILDIQMPLTDGLEAARVIGRKHPMPIIILTAFGQQELIEKAVQALGLSLDQAFIRARRFPPDMQRDIATAVHAYRTFKRKEEDSQ